MANAGNEVHAAACLLGPRLVRTPSYGLSAPARPGVLAGFSDSDALSWQMPQMMTSNSSKDLLETQAHPSDSYHGGKYMRKWVLITVLRCPTGASHTWGDSVNSCMMN